MAWLLRLFGLGLAQHAAPVTGASVPLTEEDGTTAITEEDGTTVITDE